MVDGLVVFLEREPSEGHSFLFYLNYNYSIRALTVMIYMRERISKKKRQGAELTKRLIFDEIKFKITQGIQPTEKKQIEDKGKNTGEN